MEKLSVSGGLSVPSVDLQQSNLADTGELCFSPVVQEGKFQAVNINGFI